MNMKEKIKVLWFEVSIPSRYKNEGVPIAGWQDSLERIVRTCPDIELTISFNGEKHSINKNIDGVHYIPLHLNYSFIGRIKNKISWDIETQHIVCEMQKVVEEVKPDIIHVFGTEWPFGQIAKYTKIPVVVHIMGALVPYMNALFPPCISYHDVLKSYSILRPKQYISSILNRQKEKSWVQQELEVWKNVKYYMGRTDWDKALSNVMHPGRIYFHVDEALRPIFLSHTIQWHGYENHKIKLISTGCSTFWKGPDMLLKVARILTGLNVDFEWNVAGGMSSITKEIVEKKLGTTFEENHVNFLGFVKPEELAKLLCASTFYVHTAYIENSPNAICEAQCLGLPIICTNVGGISTLVKDRKQGRLVPANDPWQMADAIMELSHDIKEMKEYSVNNIKYALERHNDENIKRDLLNCYNMIIYQND